MSKNTRRPTGTPAEHNHDQAHLQHDAENVVGACALPRLIGRAELLEMTSLSYAYIWRMMVEGRFPRPREAGGRSLWLESEVIGWIERLPKRRLKGDPAAA
jgi:predicted DNA-binding transcriptional regulator AlpA